MVTVTDEILQESSHAIYPILSDFIRCPIAVFILKEWGFWSYCTYEFTIVQRSCVTKFTEFQTFIFSERTFHQHSQQLMKARLDKIDK